MQMSVDLAFWFLFLFFTTMVFKAKCNFTPVNCGDEKILRDAKGVIQTPNFPNAFAVPIRCRWVIVPQYTESNVSLGVDVYFTQVFVTTGLNITGYSYYEDGVGYNADKVAMVSSAEQSLVTIHTRSHNQYVVIDFEMDMLEGNHLRILHHLINVYGFNITYEVSTHDPVNSSCSVQRCSMVGHCYANFDFTGFKCSCFEGFNGSNCGSGPLCHSEKTKCANSGICRYAGETMVFCECTAGYTGTNCDIPINMANNSYPPSVTLECPYFEEIHQKRPPCDCENLGNGSYFLDRSHYFLTVNIDNTTIYPRLNLGQFQESRILGEIEKSFKEAKVTKFDSLKIINTTNEATPTRTFSCHFHAAEFDDSKIRNALNSVLRQLGAANSYTLQNRVPLRLLKVSINVNGHFVPEDEEFILTCEAQCSSSSSFQWYKDGVLINVTLAMRGMWFSVLPDTDNRRMGILGIERANLYDSGTYTCQVKDWDQEQCRSLVVSVQRPPRVTMLPLNVIATKGQNVSILCQSRKDGEYIDRSGYTWAKNGELVKMDVPNVYYEDLYLGGSMLFVNNIQKSEIYSCNTASVRIDVLDKSRTPFCEGDGLWPTTGAGVTALHGCPENYCDAVVRRLCSMVDEHNAEWQLPDYSDCISNTFSSITENFREVILGYQNDSVTVSNTLNALWSSFRAASDQKLFPGEGESIVHFLEKVYQFLKRTENWSDFQDCTQYFFELVDLLLQDSTSILNQQTMLELSYLIEKWTLSWSSYERSRNINSENTLSNSSQFKSFQLHITRTHGQVVRLHPSISMRLQRLTFEKYDNAVNFSVMMYKNLSHLLLSKYSSSQWEDQELTYELQSMVVHVLLPENNVQKQSQHNSSFLPFDLEFQLPVYKSLTSAKWNVCCAIVSSFGSSWSLDVCKSISLTTYAIRCSCNHSGMFAVFAAERSIVDHEANRKYHFFVIIGCSFCFLQCVISLCVLLFRWLRFRSGLIYLKIQVCASTAAAMLLFLYGSCDPSTDTFSYILFGLQMFLLASVSSHISILIVMYIDIISLKHIPNIKVSAISVMTVSPMLLIVFAPLSRKITNEKLTCWWLCKGTLLFYIHFIVGLFFLLLFIFLYYSVMKKLFFLWNATKMERRIIVERIGFLHCSSIVFIATVVMIVSSTFYVNMKTPTSQCVFGSSCALLGFVIFVCFVPKNRISFCFNIVFPNIRDNGAKYSPELQVFATPCKTGILRHNESYETESLHSSHADVRYENDYANVCVETDAQATSKPKKKKSVGFYHDSVTVQESVQTDIDDTISDIQPQNAEVEDHNNEPLPGKELKHDPDILWPVTQNNYISTSSCVDGARCCSPMHQNHAEILTTRVCVELGVVKNASENALLGDNASTVVICSVDVEPCPGHIVELNEVKFTANTMGTMCSENAQKLADARSNDMKSVSLDKIEENKTDVLDRISQDLDYLLNRSPSPTKTRKNKNYQQSKTRLEQCT